MIGKLLDGRYQIIQTLGSGGFGQTFLARDTRRPGDPICVVKHLKPISSDLDFLATARRLFKSEAETLERLGNHDQIPRLLAYFEEEQEFYLVQDYVEGPTLTTELLPEQPWTENQTIQMLQGVLPVLEFVHNQGVIHRDIKPDNILRRQTDRKLVLVDFGAVKKTVGTQTISYTVAIGTPGYMASEQAKGQPRPSSDIYGLGAIAIQGLTGINPSQFQYDPHTGEILWQHLARVNPRLMAIIVGMVRYHFRDRYKSAREVLQALDQLSVPLAPTQNPGMNLSPLPQTPPPIAPVNTPPPAPSLPLSQKQTYAVGGINPDPTISPVPARTDLPARSRRRDRLPLIMGGVTLAVLVSIVSGVTWALRQYTPPERNTRENNPSLFGRKKETCKVVIPELNVRPEPGTGQIPVTSVTKGTTLVLTGNEENGWLEIRDPADGWVFNEAKYIDCSGTSKVAEKPKPTPTPTPTPKPSPTPTPTPKVDNGLDLLAKAREKYQAGDFLAAIAQLQAIPRNSQAYREAQNAIGNWRRTWTQAEQRFNRAQRAFDQGRWDDAIAYGNTKLPDNTYWRKKFEELSNRARRRKAEEEVESPAPEPSPEPDNPEPPEKPQKELPETPNPSPSPVEDSGGDLESLLND
ncbi:protein kinase [Lusitaniella coriacea LEGE 07157]|uniref:non-specific serine/threonine protein kinase n=1 Tax=Lusitaniella coriacea LEGE 07157 TaxID=945747 RepID=A0A8J7DV05_9CYAN|nr:protein kinase [Lusitaniella coriacea]MBE9115445.1 protein kinase [Lusitaniella coriacea LEGE 07157]